MKEELFFFVFLREVQNLTVFFNYLHDSSLDLSWPTEDGDQKAVRVDTLVKEPS